MKKFSKQASRSIVFVKVLILISAVTLILYPIIALTQGPALHWSFHSTVQLDDATVFYNNIIIAIAVLSLLSSIAGVRALRIGLPDELVEHGPQELLRANYSRDAEGIAQRILSFFPKLARRHYHSEAKG